MKLGTACLQCRKGKRKCERPPESGVSCQQCSQRNITCSMSIYKGPARTPILRPSLSQQADDDDQSMVVSAETTLELLELYFQYIHDKPHTLFHEPSFRWQAGNSRVSQAVLYGIFGLSARFSESDNTRSRGPAYAAKAKDLLKADMENICLENVQACILVGNLCLADSHSNIESLYFVWAIRMAQLLHLDTEFPAESGIQRETKRRVWWSLYMIDRWSSAGLALPRQISTARASPNLPMDEIQFHNLKEGEADPNLEPPRPGLWSHMVTLAKIFGAIQDLNRSLVQEEVWNDDHIETLAYELASQLDGYQTNLPNHVRFCTENLSAHAEKGLGRTFVALHLGYHHYATLLYFQYLDTQRPLTTGGIAYAERCKYHAAAFSDLLKVSNEYPGCEAFYNIVGHMTIVSSSVLLHTLLFGNEKELPPARQRLESNFKALIRLKSFWGSVESMINRLLIFQSVCMKSASQRTHKVDRWMVKFLLQHAMALDEKSAFSEHLDLSDEQANLDARLFELRNGGQSAQDALSELLN